MPVWLILEIAAAVTFYVTVKVIIPEKLDKEQRALLTRLAELRGENINEVDQTWVQRYKNLVGRQTGDQ